MPAASAPSPVDPCANLNRIAAELNAAREEASLAGPPPRIVAVSKKHPAETIEKALACGHRLFGENRVQEAADKWPALKEKYTDIELHLIGPLQSNKTAAAVALFDAIQSVDREKIARAIAAEIKAQNRALRLFIQINTGEEPQKAGIAPADADAFIAFCRQDFGLAFEGLMCIPPADQPPAPHFALLAKIAARNGLEALSMGMSDDYEIAAQLGASYVRIGSAIFGPRPEAR